MCWRFQYRLRTLLLLPLLVAIAAPAYVYVARLHAVLRLQRSGWKYQSNRRCLSMVGMHARPPDLAALAWFPETEALGLNYRACDRSQLHRLRHLTGLKRLSLGYSQVDDSDLRHLTLLTRLECLDLSQTAVCGPGLASLSRLHALRELSLTNCPVDDAGLACLPALPNLEVLSLIGTPVTGSSLDRLRRLPRLKKLYLIESHFSDAWVDNLAAIKSLEYCDLSHSRLTGVGCRRLKKLRPDLNGRAQLGPKDFSENCVRGPDGPICCENETAPPNDTDSALLVWDPDSVFDFSKVADEASLGN